MWVIEPRLICVACAVPDSREVCDTENWRIANRAPETTTPVTMATSVSMSVKPSSRRRRVAMGEELSTVAIPR